MHAPHPPPRTPTPSGATPAGGQGSISFAKSGQPAPASVAGGSSPTESERSSLQYLALLQEQQLAEWDAAQGAGEHFTWAQVRGCEGVRVCSCHACM